MISRINTCSIVGTKAYLVLVEADIHNGLPDFRIVGAGSSDVKDARDRVKVGIENAGFILPPKRITVSLIPAPLKKSGTSFDAAIAVSILSSFGFIHSENLSEYMILGEVALDGSLRETNGILFSVLFGISKGIKRFIVPEGNLNECSLIEDADIKAFNNLYDLAVFFNGDTSVAISPEKAEMPPFSYADFSDIKGEKQAKIALVAALAGGHSSLILGAGLDYRRKLMGPLAGLIKQSKEDILLKAAYKSIYEIPDISDYDISGIPVNYYKNRKAYTESKERLPFSTGCIEVFEEWESDEDRPSIYSYYHCKCRAEGINTCICSPRQIKERQSYLFKLKSEKALVSIALGDTEDISSEKLKEFYDKAMLAQSIRFKDLVFKKNDEIDDNYVYALCPISREAEDYLNDFINKISVDFHEKVRIIKLARTLADMDGQEKIMIKHIKYAIKLRGIYE